MDTASTQDRYATLRAAIAAGAIILANEGRHGRPETFHLAKGNGRAPQFSCEPHEYLAVVPWTPILGALAPVLEEVERATAKFPTWPTDPLHAVSVVGEEFGELTQAVLQLVYEPHKSTPEAVREEAIQVAAMAMRFVLSLDVYAYARSDQHAQAAA